MKYSIKPLAIEPEFKWELNEVEDHVDYLLSFKHGKTFMHWGLYCPLSHRIAGGISFADSCVRDIVMDLDEAKKRAEQICAHDILRDSIEVEE